MNSRRQTRRALQLRHRDENPVTATSLHSVLTPIALSPLAATLMELPASVANKGLTVWLSPLDATLTKNMGVGVPVMVNQESDKDHCPKRPPGAKIDLSRPCRATNRELLPNRVAALPPGCYDLVFHDPC